MMKKMFVLVLTGILSSQVVYPVWPAHIADTKNEVARRAAKAQYLRDHGNAVAQPAWTESYLNYLESQLPQPAVQLASQVQAQPVAPQVQQPVRVDVHVVYPPQVPQSQQMGQNAPVVPVVPVPGPGRAKRIWQAMKYMVGLSCCPCTCVQECCQEHPVIARGAAAVMCAGCGLYFKVTGAKMIPGSSVASMYASGQWLCFLCAPACGYSCLQAAMTTPPPNAGKDVLAALDKMMDAREKKKQ